MTARWCKDRCMPLPPLPTNAELEAARAALGLAADGEVVTTTASLVQPVLWRGEPAFLKLTHAEDELLGADALVRWAGHGAVGVWDRAGDAVVLERAGTTLRAAEADDAVATRVLCDVAQRLHAAVDASSADLSRFGRLEDRFASLFAWPDERFDEVREIARRRLDSDAGDVLLHGDMHHENVMRLGDGWVAIDPQPTLGAAAYDAANIFTNWTLPEAVAHFEARLAIVCERYSVGEREMLEWIAAWSALSGIWFLEDGDLDDAAFPHTIMQMALDHLAGR